MHVGSFLKRRPLRYLRSVILFDVDWHASFTYEWWRDIGTGLLSVLAGLLGVFASVIIGLLALIVARKSNAIADRTRAFQELVTNEEKARNLREVLREARLDRSAVAGKLYEYVAKRREQALGRQWQISELPPELLRDAIVEQAKYLGVEDDVREILADIDSELNLHTVSSPAVLNTIVVAFQLATDFENRVQEWVRDGSYRRRSDHRG